MVLSPSGITVSRVKLSAALRLPTGKYRDKKFENRAKGFKEYIAWLQRHAEGDIHVCIEATDMYWQACALALVDAGFTVSVIDPALISAEGMRNKAEGVDAHALADFCHEKNPPPWQAPRLSLRALREYVQRHQQLMEMTAEETSNLDVDSEIVKASVQSHLDRLADNMQKIEALIVQSLEDDPELREEHELLASIPGIAERARSPGTETGQS